MEQPIKRIDWWDSKIEIGEFDESDTFEWATITSVGFVIYESDFVITLAQDYRSDAETYRTAITIPKPCIERIQNLTLEDK